MFLRKLLLGGCVAVTWVLLVMGSCSMPDPDGNDNNDGNVNQNVNDNDAGTDNGNQNDNSNQNDNDGDNSNGNNNQNSNNNNNSNQNENQNANENDNGADNDNTNENANENSNGNENANDNSDDNGNDNGGQPGGPCPDGFALEIITVTDGAGTVTLTPPGGCYAAGTTVQIGAQANATFTFLGYSGNASGQSAVTSLTLDDDKSVTATFTGNCFVTGDDVVLEFDPLNGELVREFVSAGAGGISSPNALVFGPDGRLYVSSGDGILRHAGSTGAYLDLFVTAGQNGLGSPFGLAFGSNGNLYVADGNSVLEYDSTGAFLGNFVSEGSGGLSNATAMRFGPNGNLFVAKGDLPGSVLEYDGATGVWVREFVEEDGSGPSAPFDMTFGPDGDLYLSGALNARVRRYDGETGIPATCPCLCFNPCPDPSITTEDTYQIGNSEGLSGFPAGLAFAPNGDLLVVSNGSVLEFAVPAAGPGDATTFAADPRISSLAFITFKPLP